MSLFGNHWALKIRVAGSKKLVAIRLGDRHNAKTSQCNPGRQSLQFETGFSKSYLTQVFGALEEEQFITRKSHIGTEGDLTSNDFSLNFDRWFPFHSDEMEREQKKLLGYFRRAMPSPEIAQGLHSCWLEKPYETADKKTGERNDFRKKGRPTRSNRRKPAKIILWIAIVSQSHLDEFNKHKADILKEIEKDTGHTFRLDILRTWLKSSD